MQGTVRVVKWNKWERTGLVFYLFFVLGGGGQEEKPAALLEWCKSWCHNGGQNWRLKHSHWWAKLAGTGVKLEQITDHCEQKSKFKSFCWNWPQSRPHKALVTAVGENAEGSKTTINDVIGGLGRCMSMTSSLMSNLGAGSQVVLLFWQYVVWCHW